MGEKNNSSWLSRLIGGDSNLKDTKKIHWVIILVLIGVAIMVFSSFFNITEQVKPYETNQIVTETAGLIDKSSNPKTMQDYEKAYENQLTEVLTKMLGVEEVTVKVNLDSTEEQIVGRNINLSEQSTKEKDKQGGTREIKDIKKDEQVVTYMSENEEKPLIVKTVKPKVRGVIVVAKGAENIKVKAMIVEAVQKLLNVPPYNIGIFPKMK